MKTKTILLATIFFATHAFGADPKDEVKAATKKLSDASSYSWNTKTETAGGGGGGGGGGRGGAFGPASGKVTKDGYAMITRTFGGNSRETVIKGEKSVTKNQEGVWQTQEEAAAARAGGNGGNGNGGGRGGRGGGGGRGMANLLPAAQAEQLLASVKEWKSAEGVYSGDLTKEAVASRLTFGGRRNGAEAPPPPADAKGSAKFWVKDGVLSKYEFNVQGTMTFNNNERQINRTTTVEITDVGSTKVEVPEDAKKKLQ